MSTREDHVKSKTGSEPASVDAGQEETTRAGRSNDGTGLGDAAGKVKAIVSGESEFHPEDYHQIAEHFDISTNDVEQIVDLLTSCFDVGGRFQRDTFEKYIPEFSHYEKKIFEIIWSCLKNTLDRQDRIAFLNSMQLLIVRLKQPKKALKILLNDFYDNVDGVTDSDRDALMLSNLLIRKYNKELHTDIETTPEEVLLVRNGLDRDVIKYAEWRIESARNRFLQKIHTIRNKIVAAIDAGHTEADTLPIDFLLSLEREVHIFLSLVEGEVACRIIREAIEVYGSPDGLIYQFENSSQYLPMLLQHLKILIRGLGRVGDRRDLVLLENIKQHKEAFMQFGEDPAYQGLVRQVLQWVDISMDRTAANSSS